MRLPDSFRDASIRRKLVIIVFLAISAAMLFVVMALTVQLGFLQRNVLERSVHAQASIVATNSTAALLFDDRVAAEQTLGALAASDNIEFAGLLDREGNEFARYVRTGSVMPPHRHAATDGPANIHAPGYLEVVIPVVFKQERIGTIHVRSSMTPVYKALAWSVLMIFIAGSGALLLAVMLVLLLLPAITDPLLSLVGLMKTVSRDKNYALRAKLHGKDELGTLAQGFNSMLAQIQTQDDALEKHSLQLEDEVAQRTADLNEANAHLGKELAERKAAERELQAANEQLSILLDSLPVAVYRCRADGDHAVTYMSHNVVSFTGYEARSFIEDAGLRLDRMHPDDAPRVPAELARLFEQGMHAYQYRWLNANGTYRWILDSLRVMRHEDGTPSYLVGMWEDIDERKQAEEKVRRINEELEEMVRERTRQLLAAQEDLLRKEKLAVLGQVAGSVGHELRNPLGVMNNAVYFLQTVLSDADETTKEYLNIIKDEIACSDRIVSDLLDSVRIKPPHAGAIGLAELIGQTLRTLTVPAAVKVELDLTDTPLRVDPLQAQQVFRNLISNGLDAMPEGGTLTILGKVDAEGRSVAVSVRDTGCGIPPEQMARLFQPLHTTKARGIGLGLVVVKNLTEANNGTVAVESEIGAGTVFTITFPAAVQEGTGRPGGHGERG